MFKTTYILSVFFGFLEGNDTSLFTAHAWLLACYGCAVAEQETSVIENIDFIMPFTHSQLTLVRIECNIYQE